MAREELCGRVDHNVHPEEQGLANHRRHHGAVDAEKHVVLVRKLRQLPEIRDLHPGVRRALGVDDPRLGGDCLRDSAEIGGVHKGYLHAAQLAILRQQTVHSTVDVFVHQDLVALLEQASDGVQRCHAGGERKGRSSVLQHCHVLLQGRAGGVPRAGVVVGPELAGGGLHKRGGLVDRGVRRVVRVLRAAVEDHALRGRPQGVFKGCEVGPWWEGWQVVVPATPRLLRISDLTEVDALANGSTHPLQLVIRRLGLLPLSRLLLLPRPPHGVFDAPRIQLLMEFQ
mmetsp:Transcript_125393/g.297712  ORF Transcript_125393/g.297712 Transcript_125393/m.297712 type:complete len:284 (-) Transcript_125393:30-881(-)